MPTPTVVPTVVVPSEPLFESRGELPLTTREINELILFVETNAGRPYQHPPTLVIQPQSEFVGGIGDGGIFGSDVEQLMLNARWLQALGHTKQGMAELLDVFGSGGTQLVGGYYSVEQDALFMPADVYPLQLFAQVLVHELVHALDAQYAEIVNQSLVDEALETGNYERLNTTTYVVEGRASFVEGLWIWPATWESAERTDNSPAPPIIAPPTVEIPTVLIKEFGARYRFGPAFIRSAGGASETWDLLENPPASTEQVLVPAESHGAIVDVATPEAEGPVLDTRYVGALDLALVLDGRASMGSIARGWAGGAAVLWGDESSTCVRAAVATDSKADQGRLANTFERWRAAADGRTVEVDRDLIVATACAPLIP